MNLHFENDTDDMRDATNRASRRISRDNGGNSLGREARKILRGGGSETQRRNLLRNAGEEIGDYYE